MRQILPGLYHWTTEHPNLGRDVSSYYLERGAAVVDPMVPTEGLGAFEDLTSPERVVLSCRHHDRDHVDFVQAFGASFHVPEAGVHEYPGEQIEPYAVGDEPAPGIKAIANGPIAPDDMVLLMDVEGGALLFADSLVSVNGTPGFVPDFLLGDDPQQVRRDIVRALGEVLDERFDHLLFAHGDPILGSGEERLRSFVEEERGRSR